MEKLIELLNEYGEYDLVEHNGEICKWTTDDETGEINIYTDYTNNIISKKFGFIKWLVENDKINKFEIDTIMIKSNRLYHGKDKTTVDRVDENLGKVLLMLLSIQDNPIEFLISILK